VTPLDLSDVDALLRAVHDGDTPRHVLLAGLMALRPDADFFTLQDQVGEALDLLALRDRMLGDPDWDVYSHLDRHPVPGVEKARLERYALDCVESDLRALVRDIAGCPLGVVREAS
jgi:hypothetical protein